MVECTAADIGAGDVSSPRGNVRLVADDGTIPDPKNCHIDDEPTKTSEAFISVHNFDVKNSEGLELIRWDTGK